MRAADPVEAHQDAVVLATLIAHLGPDCIGSRAAIGVASLPAQAPVEITIVASRHRRDAGIGNLSRSLQDQGPVIPCSLGRPQ
jgi:hypothetical protein